MNSCASLIFGRFAGNTSYCDSDTYTPPRQWTLKEVKDKIFKTLDENAEFIARMAEIHGENVFDLINYKVEETIKSMKMCGGIHDILNGRLTDEDFGLLISMHKEMKDGDELCLNWGGKFYVKRNEQ